MNIALLNTVITIEKSTVLTDAIGNHINSWQNYYSCHATLSGESGAETNNASQTVDHSNIVFTIRYCSKVSGLSSDGYRIKIGQDIYDIVEIDHLSNKKKCLKLKCRKVDR